MVLVGCEYSATVRDAFRASGHDAWSNDLLPTEGDPAWHIRGCVREAIKSRRWDLIILHLDCTKMAVSGNRHYGRGKPRHCERVAAVQWSVDTWELAKEHGACVALENPVSVIFPALDAHDVQYVHPYQFGHPEQKKTGLALWNLPRLRATDDVQVVMASRPRKERERVFFMSPGPDRWKERSRTYPGIADAFAAQWGPPILQSQEAA